ncbi:MAG: NUDIX domain-containing protein [Tepidisphaeraceae bacterium]
MSILQFKLACYALVRNDKGEILLLQRPTDKRHFPNKWEFPGGKLDPGETIEQAVCREAREEAGLTITPQSLAGAVDFLVGEYRVIMLILNATSQSDQVTISNEHQAYRWIRLEEAFAMDITEQVRQFIEESLPRPRAATMTWPFYAKMEENSGSNV